MARSMSVTFNNLTNNRVESMNQKLKGIMYHVKVSTICPIITQDTRYSEVRVRSQSLKYYAKGSHCIIFSF